jgi:hypothetical protein
MICGGLTWDRGRFPELRTAKNIKEFSDYPRYPAPGGILSFQSLAYKLPVKSEQGIIKGNRETSSRE